MLNVGRWKPLSLPDIVSTKELMKHDQSRIREKEYIMFRGAQENILVKNMSNFCFSVDQ